MSDLVRNDSLQRLDPATRIAHEAMQKSLTDAFELEKREAMRREREMKKVKAEEDSEKAGPDGDGKGGRFQQKHHGDRNRKKKNRRPDHHFFGGQLFSTEA